MICSTMSLGKFTLINAMLGTKLLPCNQETCSAILTRIKDTDEFPLEKYATLTPRLQQEIDDRLQTAQQNWQEDPDLNPETALIHTGILSVEAAIQEYFRENDDVTDKIKNFVDVCSLSLQTCYNLL